MKARHLACTILLPAAGLISLLLGVGCQFELAPQKINSGKQAKINPGRYGLAAAAINNDVYIIGGSGPGGLLGKVEKFNVQDQTVVAVTNKLLPRRYHTAQSFEGKIYIIGGVVAGPRFSQIETNRVERYDPKTNEVKKLAPLPTPRSMPASVLYNGKIYVIGGSIIKDVVQIEKKYYDERLAFYYSGAVEIYDIAANKWTRGSDKPTWSVCDAVLYNGKIYAVGGYNRLPQNTFEAYDIETDRWEKLPDLPFTISAHRGAVLSGKIYTFGDYYDLNRVCQYDFATGEWSMLYTNFKPSRHNAVATCGGAIYIFGGNVASSNSWLNDIQVFRPPSL
jgi:N-acetylneuraminic acid mutarotase